jgi:O-antigen ligase
VSLLSRITLVLLLAYTALSIVFAAIAARDGLLPFSFGPINVNLFDILLLVAVAQLLQETTLEHGQGIPPANRAVLAFVLGYCVYQIAVILPVSVTLHDLEPIAVARALEDRFALILIPFVYLVVLKYMSPLRLVGWVNAVALLLAFYAVYKYAAEGTPGAGEVVGVYRLRELWGGATLLFGFLILTSLFLRRPSAFAYVTAFVGLIGLALTNHRSGYVALIVTLPPLLINSRRAATRAVVILLVVAGATGLLFTTAPATRESVMYSLRTMMNPTSDQNARDRVDRSILGLEYFAAHPLGDYTWSQRYYLVDMGPNAFEPHNFIVQLLGQQGIVGFALFAGVIVVTARIGWRNRRKDRMSAVMLACLAFYLVFCLFNAGLLNTNNILLLILPVALILARNAALQESVEEAQCAPADPTQECLVPSPGRTLVSASRVPD